MNQFVNLESVSQPEAVAALQAACVSLHTASQVTGLEDALALGRLPEAFVKSIDGFWTFYEQYLEFVQSKEKFSCRAGCSACCFDNPRGNTGVEILWLYSHLRNRADYFSFIQKVIAKASKFEKMFKENGSDFAKAQAQWKLQRNPCPFLNNENRCSVYSHRPIACRMFVALTPANWCDPSNENYAQAVNPHLEPPFVIRKILLQISKRLGLDQLPTDLLRALALLSGHVLRHSPYVLER